MGQPVTQHSGRWHARQHCTLVERPDGIPPVGIADKIHRHPIPCIGGIPEFRVIGKKTGIAEFIQEPGSQRIRCLGDGEYQRIDLRAGPGRIPEFRHHPTLCHSIIPGDAIPPSVVCRPWQLVHEGLYLQRASPFVEDLKESTATAAVHHLDDVIRTHRQRRIRRGDIAGTNSFDVLIHDPSSIFNGTTGSHLFV